MSIVSIFMIYNSVLGQDPAFSQFYSASLFLNPALGGGEGNLVVGLNQRTNTNTQTFPYYLSQVSATMPVRLKNSRKKQLLDNNGYIGGVGVTLFNEIAGIGNVLSVSGGSFSASYFMQLNLSNFIAFGLQGGVIQKNLNFDKLKFGSQFDPLIGYNSSIIPSIELKNENVLFPVFNAGVVWYMNPPDFNKIFGSRISAFSGIGVSNMNRPDESFFDSEISEIPMLFKFHGGITFKVKKQFEIIPNYLFLLQNNEKQINVGIYGSYIITTQTRKRYKLQLGSWYRFGDSFIVLLGVELKKFILGISYDYNVSTLRYYNNNGGAMELSIKYKIINNKNYQRRNISHPLI